MLADQWNEEDLAEILTNPIYTGLGPFPQLVDVNTFAGAATRLIKEVGARAYLEHFYDHLVAREEFADMMSSVGTREEFLGKELPKLKNATLIRSAIKNLLERVRSQFNQAVALSSGKSFGVGKTKDLSEN